MLPFVASVNTDSMVRKSPPMAAIIVFSERFKGQLTSCAGKNKSNPRVGLELLCAVGDKSYGKYNNSGSNKTQPVH